jgi:hypothetical protein
MRSAMTSSTVRAFPRRVLDTAMSHSSSAPDPFFQSAQQFFGVPIT